MLGDSRPKTLVKNHTVYERGELTSKQIIAISENTRNNIQTNSQKHGIHIAFLFASPLLLKDRTKVKTAVYSQDIDMKELRIAWVKYYKQEFKYEQSIADSMADIKMNDL